MADAGGSTGKLDLRAVLDALGHAVLIFDERDRLIVDNEAARALLGPQLVRFRAEGWPAVAAWLDASRGDSPPADEIRRRALRQAAPLRFHTWIGGAYTPCWAGAIALDDGTACTLVVLEQPDWSSLTEMLSMFRDEAAMTVSSTRGHARLIEQTLAHRKATLTVESLAQRVGGFARIISIHMFRLELLLGALHRLEVIRTGQLGKAVAAAQRPIELADFVDDLLEDLDTQGILETDEPGTNHRARIKIVIPPDTMVLASRQHLALALRDMLRNSLMYSPPDTPIRIQAGTMSRGRTVRIEVADGGVGIRESERGRVFAPFQRANQPEILAEFGYGLSLYLAKTEIEAMGGHLTFTSVEGEGTTFTLRLPAARGENRP